LEESPQCNKKQEGLFRKVEPNSKKLEKKEDGQEWNDVKIVSRELRKARKEKRSIEKQAKEELKEQREKNYIDNLPTFSDPEKAKTQNQAIKKQRSRLRKIKESLRRRNTGCIAHKVVPKPEREYPYKPEEVNEWKEMYDPKEVEEELLKRNKAHFSQAERTPFTTKGKAGEMAVYCRLGTSGRCLRRKNDRRNPERGRTDPERVQEKCGRRVQ
jgi:hypothetical protein